MTGGKHVVAMSGPIVADSPEYRENAIGEAAPMDLEEIWEDAAEDSPELQHANWRDWLFPALALLVLLAWTGTFAWIRREVLTAGVTPSGGIELLRDWAIPALLVGMIWLLSMRLSRREAQRFGDAARLLGNEARMLETRLGNVNRELSLAREFITAQSRDIEALGRVAVERISGHAEQLAGLVHDNSNRIDTIASVSEAALDNMEKLRGQLPVVASSAKDVTNQIGSVGRAAQTQLHDMVTGLERLNQFGLASERQVQSVREMVAETLGDFTAQTVKLDSHITERSLALQDDNAALWAQLAERESQALESIRARNLALGAELAESRDTLDQVEAENLQSLRARLTAVRDEGTAVARSLRDAESHAQEAWENATARLETGLRETLDRVAGLDQQAVASAQRRIMELVKEAQLVDERLVERDSNFQTELERRHDAALARHNTLMEQLAAQLEGFDANTAAHHEEQEARTRKVAEEAEALAAHLGGLNSRMEQIAAQGGDAVRALGASADALAGTDQQITTLTDNSVRLLELIQASVQHSKVDLPAAISVSDNRLAEIEQRSLTVRDALHQASTQGAALSEHMLSARGDIGGSLTELEALHSAVVMVRTEISAAESESQALASTTRDELHGAIEALAATARDAVSGIEAVGEHTIASLAARLGTASGAAIDEVMSARSAAAAGQLEAAAANAVGISRDASAQLRDQLAKIDELAGNLERRVNQARERAEEQVDNDFTRRVALITESLNSNAIDIARVLDTDVTDTAWSAYLKGDRGVFTRRAVKLLGPAEAKTIAQIYGNDDGFRDHVSRYIHDFEAMLRQLLSTRDGHALGVTLLSSDMGKLYVALAQAIERLRN
jgi:hypothetical protein